MPGAAGKKRMKKQDQPATGNKGGAHAGSAPADFPFWTLLWNYIRPCRGELGIASVCSLLTGIGVAVQPLLIKWIVDDGILRKGAGGELLAADVRIRWALVFSAVYAGVGLLRVVIWRFGYVRMIATIEGLLFDLRSRFFRHIQHLCLRFHDKVGSGELFNYIMGSPMQSLKTFLQQGAMFIPYQLVSWIIALATLAWFNLPMTGITLVMVVVIVYMNYRSRFSVQEISSNFLQAESSAARYISDILQGARAVKIYAMEENVRYTFETHIDRIRAEGENMANRQHLEFIKPELVQYVGTGLIYAAGAWFCVTGRLEVGEFLAFIGAVGILMGPLMSFLQLNLVRANAEAGLARIQRIFEERETTPEKPRSQRVAILPRQRSLSVQFEDVSFGYIPDRRIFHRLHCTIPAGQSVALVGSSGSGKTTFVSLLQRLYEVDAGRILLEGHDLRDYGLAELRQAFGVVPQSPFLFQMTVLDNIRITRPAASEAEVREAARIAHIDHVIQELPHGYQSWVSEGGSNFSGGQKQRIAIARAVLANPGCFIFDEATSALDNESERRIRKAMEGVMRQRTTFIIAHRLSTVRHVDRVLVFDNGRIAQDGTYEELSRTPGIFRDLIDTTPVTGT